LEALVAGKFLVKIAVGLVGFGEAAEFFCDLLHGKNIDLAASLSERI
jgi:hypothetical protein